MSQISTGPLSGAPDPDPIRSSRAPRRPGISGSAPALSKAGPSAEAGPGC